MPWASRAASMGSCTRVSLKRDAYGWTQRNVAAATGRPQARTWLMAMAVLGMGEERGLGWSHSNFSVPRSW